ncbi:hypothetical protein CO058_00920 [candidate division WWE3 bacterium CG_4_9_14_0_2_um_filter_35_11]|uniref:Uncharacterized protein n=1 Tax=candidate division WWE3 bacterium CG_4_9_14_0_2_um_filter_35_11 TaxID=1975077 RepID=A0A2M8EMI3_UNCKA|nr:MAG: hypothetical protein COV25_00600 [candidate division WWE3 bacterium CG10_big_fil_rev_8_21_14_0_10_35_32]PJC23956.1 MAG: hypothetical protein CO058_00920 [candidate division WWE3 bacterium CG_4_9_14_0_2_um_filter_35_11]
MSTHLGIKSLSIFRNEVDLAEVGVYVPGVDEVDLSSEDESSLEFIVDLLPYISDLQILSNASELAGLSHGEFIRGEYVALIIDRVRDCLLTLSELSENIYLKAYYLALSGDFGFVIKPNSLSEIAYGELIANSTPEQMVIRLGFLHDYNYENKRTDKDGSRRDLVFNICKVVSYKDIPEGFVQSLKEFFDTQENHQVTIVEEKVVLFGASQASRVVSDNVVPTGSSHIMDSEGNGYRIVIRRYVNTGNEKVRLMSMTAKSIFSSEFFGSIGIDLSDERSQETLLQMLSYGQYIDLISHEIAEGMGTRELTGTNRAIQECLFTAVGFSTLVSLVGRASGISNENLINTRIYTLSEIFTMLAGDYTGNYIPGYALMYKRLVKDNALTFDEAGFVSHVDWEIFDSVMGNIAGEMYLALKVGDDSNGLIDHLPEEVRSDKFIVGLSKRFKEAS